MEVVVVNYNQEWPSMYNQEAKKIKKILGKELIEIYHIGSTSVENLKAKPIIDIMPVVRDIEKVDQYNDKFKELGYEPMGEYGIAGRRYFRKGLENRTHHVHVFDVNNVCDIERHLAVRDYLRAYPKDSYEYGELKQELANKYPSDIEAYCLGKDSFVKNLERKAVDWYHKAK